MQPQSGSHSRLFCAPLAPLLYKNRSLPSSPVQTSISPRLPRCDCFDQGWFFVFLWSACPTIRGTTVTIVQRSAVPPLGMKALCVLCHEIGANSAARTTAKSEAKKCLMIGEDAMDFLRVCFCIQSRAFAVFVLRRLEHKNLQKFCQHAPRNSRSPSLCPCNIAFRSTVGPDRSFMLTTSLLHKFAVHCTHLFRWAVQGCLLSPQNIVVLQVFWQGFFSSLPSLVLPAASTDDGLLAPRSP